MAKTSRKATQWTFFRSTKGRNILGLASVHHWCDTTFREQPSRPRRTSPQKLDALLVRVVSPRVTPWTRRGVGGSLPAKARYLSDRQQSPSCSHLCARKGSSFPDRRRTRDAPAGHAAFFLVFCAAHKRHRLSENGDGPHTRAAVPHLSTFRAAVIYQSRARTHGLANVGRTRRMSNPRCRWRSCSFPRPFCRGVHKRTRAVGTTCCTSGIKLRTHK